MLFVLGVVVAIAAIGLAPLLIFITKADGLGAKIRLTEAFQLLSRQSTDKEFLKAIAGNRTGSLRLGAKKYLYESSSLHNGSHSLPPASILSINFICFWPSL